MPPGRLPPARIHRHMVSLAFVHADRNPRAAPPSRGRQTDDLPPTLQTSDRVLWAWLSRLWPGWQQALAFVQPRTVIAWQKKRFRDYWRRLSQSGKPGRPAISKEVRELIQDMWQSNPTWGSPRIVGELRKLGIDVAKSTVEKYRPRTSRKPSSPTWKAFLNNHVQDLVACDFFTVPTVTCRVLFVFIILAHERRRIVHFNVTEHPTAQWTAQQIVEAFPWETAPRYLLRDRDSIYGTAFQSRVKNLGIEEVKIAPHSPWQNPYAETRHRQYSSRVSQRCHRTQRAASAPRPSILRGLLSALADTPIIGDGCTGAPSGSATRAGAGQEATGSRRLSSPLCAAPAVMDCSTASLRTREDLRERIAAACGPRLNTENRILRHQIQGRMQLTDAKRKSIAEIDKQLGKKALEEVATLVTPDTILPCLQRHCMGVLTNGMHKSASLPICCSAPGRSGRSAHAWQTTPLACSGCAE